MHQGLEFALEKENPKAASSSMSNEKRKHIAHNTLILSLSDSILIKIFEENATLGILNNVEALCMKKSLTH